MDFPKKDKDVYESKSFEIINLFTKKVYKKKMIFKHKRQIYVTFYDH